jgi:hypothetical protein
MRQALSKKVPSGAKLTVVHTPKDKATHMPDLWNLEMLFPYRMEKNQRRWNFRPRDFDAPGVIILKIDDTSLVIRKSLSAYEFLRCVVDRLGSRISAAALVRVDPDRLAIVQKHLLTQRNKLIEDDLHERVACLLNQSVVHQDDVIKLLEFKDPYVDKTAKPRISTFLRKDTLYATGVYIIRKRIDGEMRVVYVGQSNGKLYQVFYHHFTPYAADPRGTHTWVDYSKEYPNHDFDATLIRIPGVAEVNNQLVELTRQQLDSYVKDLELKLILLFDPKNNTRGKKKKPVENEEPFVHSPPSDGPAPF